MVKAEVNSAKNSRSSPETLRRITVSYLTLKNSALSKIYVQHGWDGLRRSESYSERSVFEECPQVGRIGASHG